MGSSFLILTAISLILLMDCKIQSREHIRRINLSGALPQKQKHDRDLRETNSSPETYQASRFPETLHNYLWMDSIFHERFHLFEKLAG